MPTSFFIDKLTHDIHLGWKPFIDEHLRELLKIEDEVVNNEINYTPDASKVLRFFNNDLEKTKIIILGQDPYPQAGVATGRAFEVGTLKSWHQKYKNISLKNIVRALYYAYFNEYLTYAEILRKIPDGPTLFLEETFDILPPDKIFENWEKQGVLLLNTSFTCEIGKPGSHQGFWNNFSNELLNFIASKNKELIWFLWGNHAKEITNKILIKNKYVSMHPMMCYEQNNRKDDFLFGEVNHFEETKQIINWLGDGNSNS